MTEPSNQKSTRNPDSGLATRCQRFLQVFLPLEGPGRSPRLSVLTDVTAFTRGLARLMEPGTPLLQCLHQIAKQKRGRTMRPVAAQIAHAIEEDFTFSEALRHHPRFFDSFYVSMAKTGELGGNLEIVLSQVATALQKEMRTRTKLLGALVLPGAVLIVSMLLVAALALKAQPAWGVFCWNILHSHPLLFAAGGVALIAGAAGFTRLAAGQRLVDRAKLRLPLLGPVTRKLVVARCVRTLSYSLSSGVPVLLALRSVKESARNVVIAEAVERWAEAVREGESLLALLEGLVLLPNTMFSPWDHHDGQDYLTNELLRIADELEAEVDDLLAILRHIVSPILIVILTTLTACLVMVLAGFVA